MDQRRDGSVPELGIADARNARAATMAAAGSSRGFEFGSGLQDAAVAAGAFFATGPFQNTFIHAGPVTGDARVIQMIDDELADDRFAAYARVKKAFGQLGIFVAPADEIFVVAINTEEVLAPDPEIRAVDRTSVIEAANRPRPAKSASPAVEPAAQEQEERMEFTRRDSADVTSTNACAPALHERAASRLPHVIGHEAAVRQAVACEKDKIVTGRGADGPVQQGGFARLLMRLPESPDRKGQRLCPIFEYAGGLIIGTVVGDQDFGGELGLQAEAFEHEVQSERVFRCADD